MLTKSSRIALRSSLGFLFIAGAVFLAVPRSGPSVAAAAATGAVVGRVVWCVPLPLPYGAPGGEAVPETGAEGIPGTGPDAVPPMPPEPAEVAPDVRGARPVPAPPILWPIPAGAVLAAIQGTSLSARTDETGRFRIEGVPVGQYLTLAAGPVRGASTAIAVRPNVFLRDAGQVFSVGRLSLGQPCNAYGPVPRAGPGAQGQAPAVVPDDGEGDIP